jgi:signal transduction histidine kinase
LAETLQRGQSGAVNDLQHRQLGLIYSAALGLSTVSSNVIELARSGNRLADDHPAPFSVVEIMESVRDMVYPMAEEKRLSVRFLPPMSNHRVGYPHALARVLLNLTTNALKFTDEGFVEIVARENKLTTIQFSVRDTGPGIRPEALATLYMPFRQYRDRDGYAFSGTGLGLALSRRLVEAMGAELEIETRESWGTRFYFELDLPAADPV